MNKSPIGTKCWFPAVKFFLVNLVQSTLPGFWNSGRALWEEGFSYGQKYFPLIAQIFADLVWIMPKLYSPEVSGL